MWYTYVINIIYLYISMPTTKRRINVTLPKTVDIFLEKVARRENKPIASKALELIMSALEIEEDARWDTLANERNTKDAKFISHEDFWV
jgi:hypothetical protein